ncbi:hypothetical protein KL86DYS2_10975 [uncultured Dysgonomonas sp.]|uniref:Uncharacterized protein n=1 Tax=uncultured Dysgonomonas sp. TaxID=206096 RepID=A0A212J8M8_9BACT|nr:hypothetical protein KL86DYS2_10975 [uncultured Dysgonomonas sp.]
MNDCLNHKHPMLVGGLKNSLSTSQERVLGKDKRLLQFIPLNY